MFTQNDYIILRALHSKPKNDKKNTEEENNISLENQDSSYDNNKGVMTEKELMSQKRKRIIDNDIRFCRKGSSPLSGITKQEIKEKTGLSITKISITLKFFLAQEYVKYGLSKGNAKTFIITEKGLNEILVMKGKVD